MGTLGGYPAGKVFKIHGCTVMLLSGENTGGHFSGSCGLLRRFPFFSTVAWGPSRIMMSALVLYNRSQS